MRSTSHALRCSRCCFLRECPEKWRYERDAFGQAWSESHRIAYMCVHPERRHPMRVNREDAPYNPCASEGARSCPMKSAMERMKEDS